MLPLMIGALALGAVACNGSGGAETTPAPTASISSTTIVVRESGDPGDVETVCAELQTAQELSADVATSVSDILIAVAEGSEGSEAETVQAFVDLGNDLEAGLPDLLATFDRAAAAAPEEVAVEIRSVADSTALLTPALAAGFREAAEAGEIAGLQEVVATPELQEAGQRSGISALRLDNFTIPTCGFQFSN